MEYIAALLLAIGSFFGLVDEPQQPVGAYSYPTNAQLADTTGKSNGDSLTLGASGIPVWTTISGGGGSTLHVDGGGYVYPQTGDYHSAPKYVATSTTEASTFVNASTTQLTVTGVSRFEATSTWAAGIHPVMHGIYAADSSGLHLHSSNGTEVAYFGAGGGANVTLPNYTSALLQTGATGAVQEYAGTSCTNQFVRALSALGIATCEGVDISADTNLAAGTNITLTGDTLNVDDAFLLNTGDTATGDYNFDSGTFFIDSTNDRIGIVETSPQAKLSLGSGSSAIKLAVYDNGINDLYGMGVIPSGLAFGASIAATGTPQMVIKTNGSVGIGTNIPNSLLHLYGSNGRIRIEDTDSEATLVLTNLSTLASDDVLGRINFNGFDSANNATTYAYIGGYVSTSTNTAEDAYLTFNTMQSSVMSEAMRIDENGNVGIGDTSPASFLTVGNGDLFQVNSSGAIVAITGLSGATGVFNFGGATLEIPNSTNPNVDADGEVAVDTTQDQFITYDGAEVDVLFREIPRSTGRIGSTSLDYALNSFDTATTTWSAGSSEWAGEVVTIRAKTNAGTCLVRVGDGTNWTETVTANSSGASDTSLSNGTFTAFEEVLIQIGSCATSPNWVVPTLMWKETRQ